jgi:hypothetical protein
MDIGLTPQQRTILRCARAKGLSGADRSQVVPPLWAIALATLLLLLLWLPWSYVSLLLIPALGRWQRSRVKQRIAEWALDLREV